MGIQGNLISHPICQGGQSWNQIGLGLHYSHGWNIVQFYVFLTYPQLTTVIICWPEWFWRGWLVLDNFYDVSRVFASTNNLRKDMSWFLCFSAVIVIIRSKQKMWWYICGVLCGWYDSLIQKMFLTALQWRHNGQDSVWNHQPHDC